MSVSKIRKHIDPARGSKETIKPRLNKLGPFLSVGPGVYVASIAKILQFTMTNSISETGSNIWLW
jgi:hypothetical protein